VVLAEARAVGKSVLLRQLADETGVTVVDLDDLDTRALALADPATFVSGPAPVCVDEFQHVPEILDAIKAELNRRSAPGRSGDPEYGIKGLLVRNLEHLTAAQFAKIINTLDADAAGQQIAATWIGKEKLRDG